MQDALMKGQTAFRTAAPIFFLLSMLGFLIKVPAVPFHTWLPDAHVEAPTAGSVILAGVLLKMGTYGFMRVLMPMMPKQFAQFWWIIALLSLVAIIYGAFVAMAQSDLKKLIAYSSVNHMGYVTLGCAVAGATSLGMSESSRMLALNGAPVAGHALALLVVIVIGVWLVVVAASNMDMVLSSTRVLSTRNLRSSARSNATTRARMRTSLAASDWQRAGPYGICQADRELGLWSREPSCRTFGSPGRWCGRSFGARPYCRTWRSRWFIHRDSLRTSRRCSSSWSVHLGSFCTCSSRILIARPCARYCPSTT